MRITSRYAEHSVCYAGPSYLQGSVDARYFPQPYAITPTRQLQVSPGLVYNTHSHIHVCNNDSLTRFPYSLIIPARAGSVARAAVRIEVLHHQRYRKLTNITSSAKYTVTSAQPECRAKHFLARNGICSGALLAWSSCVLTKEHGGAAHSQDANPSQSGYLIPGYRLQLRPCRSKFACLRLLYTIIAII